MEEQEQQVSGMVHSLVHEEKLNRSVLHTKIQRRRKSTKAQCKNDRNEVHNEQH